MAHKKICDVCQKKINGINSVANVVGESVLCSHCYEQLSGFKILKQYKDVNTLEEDQRKYVGLARELNYPEKVIQDLSQHFERKKNINNQDKLNHYLTTTGSLLEGYHIQKYLGIVSGHVVLGTGMFSSFDASMADLTGSEASAYTEKLDMAKEVALKRAIIKSMRLGGNALIGIDVEHSVFVRDLIGVIVTGTSVQVVKKDD